MDATEPETSTDPADRLEALADRRLVVVTGKGGVGKSSVAAGLGIALAERGRRVLVLEIDPRESVHQLYGGAPSGGELVAAGDRLSYQNLKPAQALEELVRDQVRIAALARRLVEHPVFRQLADGMPGLKELAVLEHARRMASGALFDLVVLDAPATGHGVSMLAAPGLVSDVISSGPVGEIAGRLAEFLADPAAVSVAVVTLAEEMPVDETLELEEGLRDRFGRGAELLVVNGLYPPLTREWAVKRIHSGPIAAGSTKPSSPASPPPGPGPPSRCRCFLSPGARSSAGAWPPASPMPPR